MPQAKQTSKPKRSKAPASLGGRWIVIVAGNGAIVVTMPGTRYSVTYCKDSDLWLRAIDVRHDPDYPSYELTFRVRAWTAANAKARWLGWIA